MTQAVLCVDDDRHILDAFARSLRKEFPLSTAGGPEEALALLGQQGPFAVVVSDYRMPGMDGIAFLCRVRELAPETVRVLLTGNADLQMAIEAINQGQIFRFLTKPCSTEALIRTLQDAVVQYRLITAERELREKTLSGSLQVLCDMLALVNPDAFGRSSRIARTVEAIASRLGLEDLWTVKTAAMLSQIGCIILPEEVLKKVYRGEPLSPEETQLWRQHPCVAYDLLIKIPRMERVAKIIAAQQSTVDGAGGSGGLAGSRESPVESRVLQLALDFDALEAAGLSKTEAFDRLKQHKEQYDPAVFDALRRAFADEIGYETAVLGVADLRAGMILKEDVRTDGGVLLAAKGQPVTDTMIARLRSFASTGNVRQPFTVLVRMSAP